MCYKSVERAFVNIVLQFYLSFIYLIVDLLLLDFVECNTHSIDLILRIRVFTGGKREIVLQAPRLHYR